MRILFNSKDRKYKSVFGVLLPDEICDFNIDIPSSCKAHKADIIFMKENGDFYSSFSLQKRSEKDQYDIFSGEVSISEKGLYFYYFKIKTENEEFSLYKENYADTNMEKGELWQLSVIPDDYSVPDFYAGKVMYQIFPDRFNKFGECDISEKLTPFTIHNNTADIPDYLPDANGKITNSDFFGGNLAGIEKKLPYLKELGISVIYLNPIFKAYSNHRYDTCDYGKIDEMLGTEADLISLCEAIHKNGMKIILDGVFSHTGSNSIYFDKENIFKNGAYSNPASPYLKWYDFQSYPDKYTSWWGMETLPCINETEPSYLDYMILSEDSIIAKYLRLGADGFRLDVADELPDEFIRLLRKRAKEIKKDAFILGEVWEDASNKISYGIRRRYFIDSELDSTMNYPFKNAIIDYINRVDTGENFRNTIMTIAENYPKSVLDSIMNPLSTHDTARVLSILGKYDDISTREKRASAKMSLSEYEKALPKLYAAAFIQFILPGMPSIYYGDEIGAEGFEDPFCRKYFDWSKTKDDPILSFYKKLADLKNSYPEFQKGDIEVENPESGIIIIKRKKGSSMLTAVINASDNEFILSRKANIIFGSNFISEADKISLSTYGFMLF